MFDDGLFNGLFDFDGDGSLDTFERAAEFGSMVNMMELMKEDALVEAGLDPDEIRNMDDYDRSQAIEDAGLDPRDYE